MCIEKLHSPRIQDKVTHMHFGKVNSREILRVVTFGISAILHKESDHLNELPLDGLVQRGVPFAIASIHIGCILGDKHNRMRYGRSGLTQKMVKI